ncbi:MAG: hypothetical protein LBT33_05550 [Spirochaetia bacterium]|jgi:hypothetical protein|nr:hypothetical protein [Spirochaetia bacterium]
MHPEWAAFLCCCADKGKRELVNAILEHEEAIAMAGETMLAFTEEEIEWHRKESKLKYELDRRDLIAEVREKTWAKAAKKTRAETWSEANEKAYRDKLESARKFKAQGYPVKDIAENLGLPEKAVAAL